jgi:homoserine trans-succinylase
MFSLSLCSYKLWISSVEFSKFIRVLSGHIIFILTWPKITSDTHVSSKLARFRTSLITMLPKSWDFRVLSEPQNEPENELIQRKDKKSIYTFQDNQYNNQCLTTKVTSYETTNIGHCLPRKGYVQCDWGQHYPLEFTRKFHDNLWLGPMMTSMYQNRLPL